MIEIFFMQSPFELLILRLRELGFFSFFLPFLITSALFYGLLRRSQIFGKPEENVAINSVISISAAFFVWAFPVLIGINIETQLSTFFFIGLISILIISLTLFSANLAFQKPIGEILQEKFKGAFIPAFLILSLILSFGALVASGLANIFIPAEAFKILSIDTILAIFLLIMLILIPLLFIKWTSR